MSKTNTGLVAYAKAQLGLPYWYGTFGQTGTASLLESKARQYPSFYTSARLATARKQYGKRVHDCVGLIKGYLWSANNTATPKYNASQDVSANRMRSLCKESGKMNTLPEIAGVLVFMDGHVGIYEGNGNVIECTVNFGGGVVRTKLSQRKWTSWGKCPFITYEATNKPTATEKPAAKPVTGSQSTFKVGDKVKVKKGSKSYDGKSLADVVFTKTYTIDELKGKRAVLDLKGICTAVNTDDLTLATATVKKVVNVGSKVKIKKGAKSYEGKSLADFVYSNTYKVDELDGKRAVLDKKGICTAVHIDNLTVQ